MSLNAELQRNLWLEITPQRLIAAPVILALLVIMLLLSVDTDPSAPLAWLGAGSFTLTTVLWGAKQVSDSQSDEFAEGTWDAQRASGLGAWQMLGGKMLGGAAFAWYSGLWGLLLYLIGASGCVDTLTLLRGLVALLASALFFHALALLSTLLSWRKLRQLTARSGRGAGLLVGFVVLSNLATLLMKLLPDAGSLQWYGWSLPVQDFSLLSLVAFAAWALLGAQRVMRAELQFRNHPWAWMLFVIFLQVYAAGFIDSATMPDEGQPFSGLSTPSMRLVVAALIPLLFAYCFLLSERKDAIRFARLLAQLRDGNRRRALELTPVWALNLALTAVTAPLALIATLLDGSGWQNSVEIGAGFGSLLLYAVRDAALVLWCNFGDSQRRADAAALAYLMVLYGLLPALLGAFGLGAWVGLALPWLSFTQPVGLLAAGAWAAVGIDLLRRRWQQRVVATLA